MILEKTNGLFYLAPTMNIRIPALKEGQNPLSESLTPEEVGLDVEYFKSPISLEGELIFDEHMISINADIHTVGEYICDRCAIDFKRDFDVELHLHVLRREAQDQDEREAEGLMFISQHANEFSIARNIAEEILLDLPIQILCKDECKGLCYRCGADLNEGECGCERIDG
ncbi:DUF177 domain-containing protein [bacterium]|nr:DUF177 domain-containing protein [bacterium]